MPRDIPVGNGQFLISFDRDYRIADIYFPFVGMENHSGGRFRFGIWEEGRFSWLESQEWTKNLNYLHETLVTEVVCENESWGLRMRCYDAVDSESNVYLRKIVVRNLRDEPRTIKLFFHQHFQLYGNAIGDTALFDPTLKSIIHYKSKRYFSINTATEAGAGVTEYACGRTAGAEGTWRDAEDGKLSMNAIAQGAVDSTVGVSIDIPARGAETAYYWICAGERFGEVAELNSHVLSETPARLIARTASFWYSWVNKMNEDLSMIPADVAELYKRSLLVVRTQCDRDGAILAANDSDIQWVHNDHYSYMWPRDGALVADAMDRAGFHDLTRAFLRFAHRIIKKEGYFLHKYNPDGSVASSWHPWVRNGKLQLPIQEDETALVIWTLGRFYERTRDLEFVKSVYRRLVVQAADFMVDFRNPETGLPLPTYDLWEERQGVFTFTCASVYGGLAAAAEMAGLFNEQERRHRYLRALNEIRDGMIRYLWMPEQGRFARGLIYTDDSLVLDPTVDASLYGTFYFGAFGPDDPMVEGTMRAIREKLWIPSMGGVARYENDRYHRSVEEVTGNPWFISTLWLAEHTVAKAASPGELESALDPLRWVRSKALPSLIVAEQIHPLSGAPLSVSPLTWSHAQIVSVVRAIIDRARFFDTNRKETGAQNAGKATSAEQVDNPTQFS